MGEEREGLHGRAEGKKSQMVHRMLHKVGMAYSLCLSSAGECEHMLDLHHGCYGQHQPKVSAGVRQVAALICEGWGSEEQHWPGCCSLLQRW